MRYHLKLQKGLSYCGVVSATKQKPDVFTEDGAVADAAVATGYFVLVGTEETGKSEKAGKAKSGKSKTEEPQADDGLPEGLVDGE
jgi:hypothetical protein